MINISDVYTNSKWSTERGWLEICNPMNDFMDTFKDSEYRGCIGMELAKRPNSGGYEPKSDGYTEEFLQKCKKRLRIKYFVNLFGYAKEVKELFKKFYDMEPYLFIDEKECNILLLPMKKTMW